MRLVILVLFSFISITGLTQEIKVTGKFLTDSIRIGEPTPYALSARYPEDLFLLFPDSLDSFNPFEYDRKIYFPTITKGGISLDSAIYWVTSFEIDRIQFLSLSLLRIDNGDSILYPAVADSIFLSTQVKSIPDSVTATNLPLKTNTVYKKVTQLFNYPAFLIGSVIFISILGATWIAFGKRIMRWWKRKKLTKGYQIFEKVFQQTLDQIKTEGRVKDAEKAIQLWKNYLENLEKIPYTKFTTREILALGDHEEIRHALRATDLIIYGNKISGELTEYYTLKSFSQDRFYKKLEELK